MDAASAFQRSGVKIGTVKDFESERHVLNANSLAAIARAFQKNGLILFFDGDGGGAGVRLKEEAALRSNKDKGQDHR